MIPMENKLELVKRIAGLEEEKADATERLCALDAEIKEAIIEQEHLNEAIRIYRLLEDYGENKPPMFAKVGMTEMILKIEGDRLVYHRPYGCWRTPFRSEGGKFYDLLYGREITASTRETFLIDNNLKDVQNRYKYFE